MQKTDYIRETIKQYGQSFYFYDLDAFEAHIKSIKETLHPDIRVWYACKANPLSDVLRLLNSHGFGVDVASLGELKQARSSGFGPQELIATGPAKSRAYLASLLQANVKCIIIESHNQLKDLNELCLKLNIKQDVLLRVQLEWNGSDKSVLGGSSVTPFGLGIDDWKSIDLSLYQQLNVIGLHSFQWGNVLEVGHLKALWEYTIQSCKQLAYDLNIEMKVLDLGGGLGISYSEEREISFPEVHSMLVELKTKFELNQIWLELGRFSIGKFGSYFTKIVDVKSVRGKNLIVTEGGINHMARPALVNESFPCVAFQNSATQMKTFAVHGPLCTALDKLGEFSLPENLAVGEWLEFKRAGAYGFSESMPYFLCHSLVGEAVLYKGELSMPRVPKTNLEWMV
jgi:diaminopimelate decarboxylase